jgi:hypothetical protein
MPAAVAIDKLLPVGENVRPHRVDLREKLRRPAKNARVFLSLSFALNVSEAFAKTGSGQAQG